MSTSSRSPAGKRRSPRPSPTPSTFFMSEGAPASEMEVHAALHGLLTPAFFRSALSELGRHVRARVLSIPVLTVALLHFVVGRMPALLDLVDRLANGKVGHLPPLHVSRQAFYQRLTSIPHTVFLRLACAVNEGLAHSHRFAREDVVELAGFAARVFAIDQTTLDAMARRTEALRSLAKGATETLAGRLSAALDLCTGRFAVLHYDEDSATNEKAHLPRLLERLPVMSMLVLDCGYFGYTVFDCITQHFCFFVTRVREKMTFDVVQVLKEDLHIRESIILPGKYRADRAQFPVRMVELKINGMWHGYLTNVLSPRMLPALNIWKLYQHRWTIEVAFASIKRVLGLAYIRVTHLNGILIQVWCTLLLFQVLQSLRIQIAHAAGWNADDVSWEMLVRRIGWYGEGKPPAEPLVEWLCADPDKLRLKKRGVRQRMTKGLPKATLEQFNAVTPEPDWDGLQSRAARVGHVPQPRAPMRQVTVNLEGHLR